MPTFIACIIAGICLVGFVTIWLKTAYKELSAKRTGLIDLENQLILHEQLAFAAMDCPEALSAEGMLKTSRMLYREAAKGYNRILRKPTNRFPALVMGFRMAKENIQCEKEEQNK